MFIKKDYKNYFKELYEVEIGMKKEAKDLLKFIDEPEFRKILLNIIRDEERHAKIVKSMMKLI